jgi:hypothetical protein
MFTVHLTSLGEERAETLIRFGGFAFLGQVSIRLLWQDASENFFRDADRVRKH